jgi:hypothetical protein
MPEGLIRKYIVTVVRLDALTQLTFFGPFTYTEAQNAVDSGALGPAEDCWITRLLESPVEAPQRTPLDEAIDMFDLAMESEGIDRDTRSRIIECARDGFSD